MMKNIWLKKFSIFALILLLALVPACSGDEEPSEEPGEEPAVVEPVEEPVVEEPEDLISDDASLFNLFGRTANLGEYSYQMTFETAGVQQGSMTFYMKGEKIRMEGEADGQETLMIVDGEFMYMGEPNGQMMKFPVDTEDSTGTEGGAPSIESFTQGASSDNMTFVGYEEYEGFNCPVAEMKDPEDGSSIRLWLHPEFGFPLKMVNTGATAEESFVMLVTNFKAGKVSDDMFEVPADADILDMSDMFEGMVEGMDDPEDMEDMLSDMEDMIDGFDMDE
jgi:outer membrane lipoprotein-sorting protein